jgi:hypothetical protein
MNTNTLLGHGMENCKQNMQSKKSGGKEKKS